MDDYYAARSGLIPPLPWPTFSPPFSAPIDAIDYVITHELCHVAIPHHGPAFFELLDRVLPDWPKRKERLEQRMA